MLLRGSSDICGVPLSILFVIMVMLERDDTLLISVDSRIQIELEMLTKKRPNNGYVFK